MLRWVIRLRIEISDSRFSNNLVVSLLLMTALIATLSLVSYPSQRVHESSNNNGVRRGQGTHDARPSEHSSERATAHLLSDSIRSDTVLALRVSAPPTPGISGRLVIPPSVPLVRRASARRLWVPPRGSHDRDALWQAGRCS